MICPARAIWAWCCCDVDSRAPPHKAACEFIPLLWPLSGRSNGSPFKSTLFYCTERFRAICLQCVQIHHLANCDQIAAQRRNAFCCLFTLSRLFFSSDHERQFSRALCLSAAKSNFLIQQPPIEFFARLKVTQSQEYKPLSASV